MRILFIYRSKELGPSIRRVFEPIEQQLRKTEDVDSIYLPIATASPTDVLRNIQYVNVYLKGKQYDVIHITGHVHYLAWSLRKYNTIVTVHDLGFYTNFSSGIKKRMLYAFFIYPLRFAKHITYISDKSFDEANKQIKMPAERQSVIYDPVDPVFVPCPKAINKENPVILHLGTKVNKNLERVVEAVFSMKCTLHVVGKISDSLSKRIKELGINARLECNITDEEVMEAYNRCDVVCFPSLYEGFGMPIIEGQAVGRPVVTSDVSPMRQIAGKGAVLVDPCSVESIREGLKAALQNADALIEEGFMNVSRFSIDTITSEYLKLYKSVSF